MPRPSARLSRVRSVPWLLVLRAAQLVWTQLRDDLSPEDRRRLGRLVRTPPHRLTAQERDEIRTIVGKVDLSRLGADLVGLRKGRR
jgi:hypothetical protein